MFALGSTATVSAHEISPTIISATVEENLTDVSIEVEGNLEALISQIGGEHEDTEESPQAPLYNSLRELSPEALRAELEKALPRLQSAMNLSAETEGGAKSLPFTLEKSNIPAVGDVDLARLSALHFKTQLPEGTSTLSWQLDKEYGASVFRLALPGEERLTEWLQDGKTSRLFDVKSPEKQTFMQTVVSYIEIGFVHILPKGLDHILFVVGLFLISPFIRPLLWQVTAFTAAHTITIALGVLGLVSIPGYIVEPLIAASIILIALENMMTKSVSWWRTGVVFVFGLLHGLGFAGVLSEIGLPDGQFVTALISFNVGVELGQLCVILICFLAVGLCFLAVGLWLRNTQYYDRWVKIPGSLIIAIVATYWFLERTVLA